MRLFLTIISLFFVSFLYAQKFEDVPLRADEDFLVQLDLKIKQKTIPNVEDRNLLKINPNIANTDHLPFITLLISLKNVKTEEVKTKIINESGNLINTKKISTEPVEVVIGFTADVVAGISSSKFTVLILNKKKKPLNKIYINIEKDGSYYINGKLNGKL